MIHYFENRFARHVMRQTVTAVLLHILSLPHNILAISTVKPWTLKKANVHTVLPL